MSVTRPSKRFVTEANRCKRAVENGSPVVFWQNRISAAQEQLDADREHLSELQSWLSEQALDENPI